MNFHLFFFQKEALKTKLLIKIFTDVTNYKELACFGKKVKDILGDKGLEVLINNAGIKEAPGGAGIPLEKFDSTLFLDVMNTNTVAPIMLIKVLFILVIIKFLNK